MDTEPTPVSARIRLVIRLTLVSVAAGVVALALLQIWATTGNWIAFYLGVVTAVVTALAFVAEFAAAVAPQVGNIRRTYL
jgi:hypothetical protein